MNQTINDTGIKRAALINDLSCIGKCSLSVALPIVSACGVEAVALPTAVLSTHTGGFEGYVVRDMTEEMRSFAAHWKQMGVRFRLHLYRLFRLSQADRPGRAVHPRVCGQPDAHSRRPGAGR